MKTPIAIYNLRHQGPKTLVSIGGVAFALLLVFMQLGFMGAVEHTAENVLEKLDCDILIRANDYLHLYESSVFDRQWLEIARSTPGIASVDPLWVMIHNWRKLPTEQEITHSRETESASAGGFTSQYLPIAILAFEPGAAIFLADEVPEVVQYQEALTQPECVLLDDASKGDYGPWNGRYFSQEDVEKSQDPQWPERRPEIGGAAYQIAGLFKLGTGLAANAAAIMGRRGFSRISPFNLDASTSLGLVRLQDASPAGVEQALEHLRKRMQVSASVLSDTQAIENSASNPSPRPNTPSTEGVAVSILSKADAIAAEKHRWLRGMPIGLIFQMGVAISLLVGAAIVYMVLSTDVAARLPEYATLLAMGYSRSYLASIVMTQAIVLCGLGFSTAWACGEVLYRVTAAFSGIPMQMTLFHIGLVALLGLVMCCASGLLALRKLWKAEPANLF